jgi:aminoglycoside phosphotransferase (APT) family kinase protein
VADVTGLRPKLEAWLQTRIPEAKDITVLELQRPGTGASSDTQLVDLRWDEAGEPKSVPVVLRSAPPSPGVFPTYDLGFQFRVLKALNEHTDVPVPKVLWLEEDASVIGAPFFLMQRLEGDVPQDFPSYHTAGMYFDATPAMRRKMWWECLDALVRLHTVDWKRCGLEFVGVPKPGTDAVDRQLSHWESYLTHWVKKEDPQESHPTMEATLVWLKAHRYEPEHVALNWGDAKLGNVLYSRPDRNLLALLDWEGAGIGDPEQDLASLYISDLRAHRGQGIAPLDGTPTVEELIDRYERLSGRTVKHFLYNEVLATFWRGLVQIRIMKDMRAKGMNIPAEMIWNNFPTQHLSRLLQLPPPGS